MYSCLSRDVNLTQSLCVSLGVSIVKLQAATWSMCQTFLVPEDQVRGLLETCRQEALKEDRWQWLKEAANVQGIGHVLDLFHHALEGMCSAQYDC